MKLLFVHDHRFYKEKGDFYSSGGFPKNIWSRYLENFSSMIVIGRKLDKKNLGLVQSSTEKVEFNLIEEYKNPIDEFLYPKKIDNNIIDSLKQVDAAIVRLPSILGFRTINICKKINKPYAIEVVGCAWDSYWYYGNLKGKLLALINYNRMKGIVRDSKFTIYVTRLYLQNRYKTNGFNTYASNVDINDNPDIVLHNHKKIISDNKKCIFGMLGNLDVYYKGYDIAIKALAYIKNDIPDFMLYIVGNGDGNNIRRLLDKYDLNESVKILKPIKSGEQVYEFLDNLNMYLHPALTEGLPRALIEAMSRGCPVLASSVGGIPELLNGKYLHQPGDYKQLSKQIENYSSDKEKLLLMANENFIKAKEYTNSKLNKRRSKFFKNFRDSI